MADTPEVHDTVTFKTPIGPIAISGASLTLNTLLTVVIFGMILALSVWVWKHKDDMENGRSATNSILQHHEETQVKMIQAIRENTCILSKNQEDREKEFNSPNGICKRMTHE